MLSQSAALATAIGVDPKTAASAPMRQGLQGGSKLAVGEAHLGCAAGVDGGKVEGGAAMTSSNPVYKRRRLDISPPQQQVGMTSP